MTQSADGQVSVDINGQPYHGEWHVNIDTIAVEFDAILPKFEQLEGRDPEAVAKLLLAEMVHTYLMLKQLDH